MVHRQTQIKQVVRGNSTCGYIQLHILFCAAHNAGVPCLLQAHLATATYHDLI